MSSRDYLSNNAIAAADPSLVRQLCGRPLFISHFWTFLLTHAAQLNSTRNIDLSAVFGLQQRHSKRKMQQD
jgi:hypothetical protein